MRFAALIAAACVLAAPAAHADLTYTTVDAPGEAGYSYLSGINNSGVLVGSVQDYSTYPGNYTSFTATGGSFSFFNDPSAGDPSADYTTASGINASGTVVGTFGNETGTFGFIKSGNNYTQLSDPKGVNGTVANGISGNGTVVGTYYDSSYGAHGFTYVGGVYTTVDVPGASDTYLNGISPNGNLIVGKSIINTAQVYATSAVIYDGGVFNTISLAGSSVYNNVAYGVNNSGQVVGCTDQYGFLSSGGTITLLSDPNQAQDGYTCARGINNAGTIVGLYGVQEDPDGFIVTASVAVSEPGTLAVLGSGLFALIMIRRRSAASRI